MAKKFFCIVCLLIVSYSAFAVSAFFSVGRSDSVGYMGFSGTDTLSRRKEADLKTGITFSDGFSAYLSAGTGYSEELKSFSSFSSLANSFSMNYALGINYAKNLFAYDLCAGLRTMNLAFDKWNKYAFFFVKVNTSINLFSASGFKLFFNIPIQFSFNGYGKNIDIGTGFSLTYRVNRRGS